MDWDECRGSLLRENPETGSFYVPTGSGEFLFLNYFSSLSLLPCVHAELHGMSFMLNGRPTIERPSSDT